jgi:hypothetical protein
MPPEQQRAFVQQLRIDRTSAQSFAKAIRMDQREKKAVAKATKTVNILTEEYGL